MLSHCIYIFNFFLFLVVFLLFTFATIKYIHVFLKYHCESHLHFKNSPFQTYFTLKKFLQSTLNELLKSPLCTTFALFKFTPSHHVFDLQSYTYTHTHTHKISPCITSSLLNSPLLKNHIFFQILLCSTLCILLKLWLYTTFMSFKCIVSHWIYALQTHYKLHLHFPKLPPITNIFIFKMTTINRIGWNLIHTFENPHFKLQLYF